MKQWASGPMPLPGLTQPRAAALHSDATVRDPTGNPLGGAFGRVRGIADRNAFLATGPAPGKATVCIGLRRSGKPTYLFQIIQRLLDDGVPRRRNRASYCLPAGKEV